VDLKDAIEAVRPAVVQIRDGNQHVLGTGFFIDEAGHVATARHVVENQPSVLIGLAHPNTENMRANFSLTGATVIAEDKRHDLAILQMHANPFKGEITSGIVIGNQQIHLLYGTATLDATRPQDGEGIAISGYPLANPALVTTSGAIGSAWNYDSEDVHVPGAPPGFTMPDIADTYLADVQANPGNSGGPTYRLADAAIIGVCIEMRVSPTFDVTGTASGFAANAGLTVVRPVRYLADLIVNAGI
jgi:S1-C subfamily serine protease